ncbi:MAG TPA: sporulation protein YtfJ [Firmicutes bacterium]|nr:sporulation protein YtfJ [Bacillota bacterium]
MDGNSQHPIEGIMKTAMENIKTMVDVNTILGDPVETADGSVIIPVSRVSFGFAAGGSEFTSENQRNATQNNKESYPFGGGSGAGISLHPVAFLVLSGGQVRLLPISKEAILDRVLDLVPQVMDQLTSKGNNNSTSTLLRNKP